MNEITQWQLSPGKIYHQFENVYYGSVTTETEYFLLWQLKPEFLDTCLQ